MTCCGSQGSWQRRRSSKGHKQVRDFTGKIIDAKCGDHFSTYQVNEQANMKALRAITNALWYVRNVTLHNNLKIEQIEDTIKHETRLNKHSNIEVFQILDNSNELWRLKRTKPLDLV